MVQPKTDMTIIGRAEEVILRDLLDISTHARIDTGARTSAIYISSAKVVDGKLHVVFFGPSHKCYTGEPIAFDSFGRVVVASSNGQTEARYTVKLRIILQKRKIVATFTLTDRSTQVYPVLIGRNVLRGKFIVDVKEGTPLTKHEKQKRDSLRQQLEKDERTKQ